MKGGHPSILAVLSYLFPEKNSHLISFSVSYCSELCVNKCEKGTMLLNTSHRFCALEQASIFLSVFIHNSSRVKLILKFNFSSFGHRFLVLVSPSCISIRINKHILIHMYVEEILEFPRIKYMIILLSQQWAELEREQTSDGQHWLRLQLCKTELSVSMCSAWGPGFKTHAGRWSFAVVLSWIQT